jgi:hypothetical protein
MVLINLFFIVKKKQDLIRFTGSAFVANSERRLLKLRADYRHESWSEAMQFIDTRYFSFHALDSL